MNGKKAKAIRRQEKADELARKEWREYLRRGLTRPATTMTLDDLNKANAKVQEIGLAEETKRSEEIDKEMRIKLLVNDAKHYVQENPSEAERVERQLGEILNVTGNPKHFDAVIFEQPPAKEDWLVDRVAALSLETEVKTKEYLEGLSLLDGKLETEKGSGLKALLPRPALKGPTIAEFAEHQRCNARMEKRRTIKFTPIPVRISECMPSRTYRLCDECYTKSRMKDLEVNPDTCPDCMEVVMDPTINRADFEGDMVVGMAGYNRMPKLSLNHEQPRHLYNGVSKEIHAAIIISQPLEAVAGSDLDPEALARDEAKAEERRTINFKPVSRVPGHETQERTFRLCTSCHVALVFEIMEINPAGCTECKEVEFDSTKDFSHLAESFQPSAAQLVLKEVKAEYRRDDFNLNFFFCPVDTTGLEKLTEDQRIELLENQGNYMVALHKSDPMLRGDLICACENGRIPTHRKVGAKIPAYGDVPFDFSNLK